ncbi:MAG: serine acetyltransferase [Lentisphaeria bacterium]|nr:serine acetyltransferase [Lentisphaeria bacterium]
MSCNCARINNRKWDVETNSNIVESIYQTYEDTTGINHIEECNLPQHTEIIRVLKDLIETIFPGYSGRNSFSKVGIKCEIGAIINSCFERLSEQIERSLNYYCTLRQCEGSDCKDRSVDATIKLLECIPKIREVLKKDIHAFMSGDPAASSKDEVISSYPGIKALVIHRIAHELYKDEVPFIPRVMSEHAHHETGIDIHPGATIDSGLFIDHGTGVVVGETAIIGKNCKLYQGVTLGAISFPTDKEGNAIKGQPRHPILEDHVTVYASATILGNINIGHHSVVGGNVWLMDAIPPYTHVSLNKPELHIRTKKK